MLGEHRIQHLAHAKQEWNPEPCVCKVSMDSKALHMLGDH